MAWQATLRLDYTREADRTVARFRHEGPLRILQSLHPEGPATCHNVLVHPPSGLVAGDVLDIGVTVGAGAHGLVTTPGAGRFYRSEGEPAVQQARLALGADSRLEWLPLETIYYDGCIADNRVHLDLAPGAEVIGWDVAALGLPQAGQPFRRGRVLQHLELRSGWLERGRIAGDDARLLDGPLGLAGHRCVATLFFAAGAALPRERRERALDLARDAMAAHPDVLAGATSPHPDVVVLRALAPLVEPAMRLLQAVRRAWRPALWSLAPTEPRGWVL